MLKQEDDEILLRVILGFIAWAQDNDVHYCYFLINAALARVLKRLRVPLVEAGPEVEHRGRRRPYRTHIATTLNEMRENLPQVARILERSKAYIRYSEFAKPKPATAASAPAQDYLTGNELRQRAPRIA